MEPPIEERRVPASEKPLLVATCALGTETAVKQELLKLKMARVRQDRGTVDFAGDLADGMKACLHLRGAMRVLWPLATFPAANQEELYEGARSIRWADYLTPKHTFAVDASGSTPALNHTGFVALKVKDAIVDTMREMAGSRPDVDGKHPDVPVVVHLHKDKASISLDLCGAPLHRRGYRPADADAPLKETLAAAMLILAGYDGTQPFVDPMAGSGTLLVEAAWMAMKRAPGLGRHFAFERWPMFAGTPQGKWHRMLHEAEQAVVRDGLPMLLGRDWLPKPMAWMEESVHRAGLDGLVRVEHGDVRKLRLPPGPGHVVTNPPYAERLGKDLQILGLYRSLGEVIPTWEGWNVAILSGHPRFPSEIGLRDQKRIRMFNGAIPCGFHLYGNAAQ